MPLARFAVKLGQFGSWIRRFRRGWWRKRLRWLDLIDGFPNTDL